jgi:hypothetical protein
VVRRHANFVARLDQPLNRTPERLRVAEEALSRRRAQPASVGRVAERDFAAHVGGQSDFRVSPKLPKGGDYLVWPKVPTLDGVLAEIAEPVLVDVKKESAALHPSALSKLVRDCRARGCIMGALVADSIEDIAEVFGSPRVRLIDGVTIVLTSLEAFPVEMRLLGPYYRHLLDIRRDADETVVIRLAQALTQVMQHLSEIESDLEKA